MGVLNEPAEHGCAQTEEAECIIVCLMVEFTREGLDGNAVDRHFSNEDFLRSGVHLPAQGAASAQRAASAQGVAKRSGEPSPISARALIDHLEAHHTLTTEQWIALFAAQNNSAARTYLFERARAIRDQSYGRRVFLRGLIEYSNYCKNDCLYCGIRASNTHIRRYRLDEETILACCEIGYRIGYRTFVLQGGEDPHVPLVRIVQEIRKRYPDCAITLSAGELSRASYKQLFDAGADRYLLRHETADPCHYGKLHPASMSGEYRRECLFTLREIGFQVGSGFLVGAPGETPQTMAANMRFLHELNPHMIGIGPFIPHVDTPLGSAPAGTMEETLFMLACLRLAHPKALLPATTALASIDPLGRIRGLDAGANVIMPNLSPHEYRKDYALYNNKLSSGLEAAEHYTALAEELAAHGYTVDRSRGDSLVA